MHQAIQRLLPLILLTRLVLADPGQEVVGRLRALDFDGSPRVARAELERQLHNSNRHVVVSAEALLYEHADVLALSLNQRERLRQTLQTLALDRGEDFWIRSDACKALFTWAWPGRDGLFLQLALDPTFYHQGFSPLDQVVRGDQDHWVARMLPMLTIPGQQRNQAAGILGRSCDMSWTRAEYPSRELLLGLLPWLDDLDWARDTGGRSDYLKALARSYLSEAVPGWLSGLQKQPKIIDEAVRYFTAHPDPRAVPTLREKIQAAGGGIRWRLFDAMIACGGVKADEGTEALEVYAQLTLTDPERSFERWSDEMDPLACLGNRLAEVGSTDQRLIDGLIKRSARVRADNPALGLALERILFCWRAPAVQRYCLRRLTDPGLQWELFDCLLPDRKLFADRFPGELKQLLDVPGRPGVCAALLLEDEYRLKALLATEDEAGCLQILKASLPRYPITRDNYLIHPPGKQGPVALGPACVGPLTRSPNPTIAEASRHWLRRWGGQEGRVWLASEGQPLGPIDAESHCYNIQGLKLGMSKNEAGSAGARSEVTFSESGKVSRVRGRQLFDGTGEVLNGRSLASDALLLLGQPDKVWSRGHVIDTSCGFIWVYRIPEGSLILTFVDDFVTPGRERSSRPGRPLYRSGSHLPLSRKVEVFAAGSADHARELASSVIEHPPSAQFGAGRSRRR